MFWAVGAGAWRGGWLGFLEAAAHCGLGGSFCLFVLLELVVAWAWDIEFVTLTAEYFLRVESVSVLAKRYVVFHSVQLFYYFSRSLKSL